MKAPKFTIPEPPEPNGKFIDPHFDVSAVMEEPAHTPNTKAIRQQVVAEIRSKMPESKKPAQANVPSAVIYTSQEFIDWGTERFNEALNRVNLILTEIEGGE